MSKFICTMPSGVYGEKGCWGEITKTNAFACVNCKRIYEPKRVELKNPICVSCGKRLIRANKYDCGKCGMLEFLEVDR